MCLWSYRCWGGFSVEASSPLSLRRALASSAFYSKMLAEADRESISFIVWISYHFLPHHPLVSFIDVHSYFFLSLCSFLLLWSFLQVWYCAAYLASHSGSGLMQSGIWFSCNPASVRNRSDPYFLIAPPLLKWFQTCAVIRSLPCLSSLPGFSPPHLSGFFTLFFSLGITLHWTQWIH